MNEYVKVVIGNRYVRIAAFGAAMFAAGFGIKTAINNSTPAETRYSLSYWEEGGPYGIQPRFHNVVLTQEQYNDILRSKQQIISMYPTK